MLDWKRPENVPFPSVWRRFDGRKEIDGKIPKFWVQDLPENMFEAAVETMCKSFIIEEPLCKFSKLADEQESIEEIKYCWRKLVQQKLVLICFMENPTGEPIIAGLNMTFASIKGDQKPEFKAKKWVKVHDVVELATNKNDPYEILGITEYMSALGLTVLPQFRGQGIGFELLQARTEICKAVGIKATLTVFTATASQILAERSGFKDMVVVPYDQLEIINPTFRFPGILNHTKTLRFMYKVF